MITGATLSTSYLEELSVTEPVAKHYRNQVRSFDFVDSRATEMTTESDVDNAIVECLNFLYFAGEAPRRG